MRKIKKVYLPKWQRTVIIPLLFGIWIFITYQEFFGPIAGDMGTINYLFMSTVLFGASIVIWLMASGKLPAYVIEEKETPEE